MGYVWRATILRYMNTGLMKEGNEEADEELELGVHSKGDQP